MKKHTFTVSLNVHTVAIITILFSTFATAATIRVSQDQPTIQDGINAASNGDMVLVAENRYYENISFMGKAITVASHYIVDGDTSHINNTIIDGSRPKNPDIGSVVSFVTPGEDTTSVLNGFTITGGIGTFVGDDVYREKDGGGIYIRYAGAKIVNNKIINNHTIATADTFAGGAAIFAINDFGNLVIRNNSISDNSATATGTGQAFGTVLVNTKNTCIFENNRIENNVLKAPNSSAFAAGLMIDGWKNQMGNYVIRNNIIRNNKFDPEDCGSGGGAVIQNCSPLLYNNIISENSGNYGGGVWIIHYMPNVAVAPKPRIINNTIINNTAIEAGGGILVG